MRCINTEVQRTRLALFDMPQLPDQRHRYHLVTRKTLCFDRFNQAPTTCLAIPFLISISVLITRLSTENRANYGSTWILE